MAKFLRFVVGTEAENAFWLTGVFTITREMRDRGELYGHESQWLEEVFDWFSTHLPCPPFREKRGAGEWTEDAVSWFRDDAGEVLRRMWDLVALLREHGVAVRVIATDKPGNVVYSDDYQVVAETPRWA